MAIFTCPWVRMGVLAAAPWSSLPSNARVCHFGAALSKTLIQKLGSGAIRRSQSRDRSRDWNWGLVPLWNVWIADLDEKTIQRLPLMPNSGSSRSSRHSCSHPGTNQNYLASMWWLVEVPSDPWRLFVLLFILLSYPDCIQGRCPSFPILVTLG